MYGFNDAIYCSTSVEIFNLASHPQFGECHDVESESLNNAISYAISFVSGSLTNTGVESSGSGIPFMVSNVMFYRCQEKINFIAFIT